MNKLMAAIALVLASSTPALGRGLRPRDSCGHPCCQLGSVISPAFLHHPGRRAWPVHRADCVAGRATGTHSSRTSRTLFRH